MKRIAFFIGGMFLGLAGFAAAQTVPTFYPGSAPTLSVWNAYFASKQDLIVGGANCPSGVTAATVVVVNGIVTHC